MPEWRFNLMMRTPVSRVGSECVKIIVAFSKNPIVEELKKFNRNTRPIKGRRTRIPTDYVDQDYRIIYFRSRHLTKANFVTQWQARVFRVLHCDILIRAFKTNVKDVWHYNGPYTTRHRTKWDLEQKDHIPSRESKILQSIRLLYRREKLKRKDRESKAAQSFWDNIPLYETVFGIPIIVHYSNARHVETLPSL
jgi:hypothetical protein